MGNVETQGLEKPLKFGLIRFHLGDSRGELSLE